MLNETERQKKDDQYMDFLPQLDFKNEQRNIKHLMKQSERKLAFKSDVATDSNFIQMLSENPKILHISCHGLKIELKTGFYRDKEKTEKENCLLFEKENGEGHLINSKHLNRSIKKQLPDLDVIFLAACNSEFAGKIFLKCGAKHVICIKKDKEGRDDVAVEFTELFYKFLFAGESVCKAFDRAKDGVTMKFTESEANLFTIFTHEQLDELNDPTIVQTE